MCGLTIWGSEPKRAYYAALFLTHEARVIIKNASVFYLGSTIKTRDKKRKTIAVAMVFVFYGVRYGARTHDLQGHNLTR